MKIKNIQVKFQVFFQKAILAKLEKLKSPGIEAPLSECEQNAYWSLEDIQNSGTDHKLCAWMSSSRLIYCRVFLPTYPEGHTHTSTQLLHNSKSPAGSGFRLPLAPPPPTHTHTHMPPATADTIRNNCLAVFHPLSRSLLLFLFFFIVLFLSRLIMS